MSKYNDEQKAEHKEIIKRILVRKPQISIQDTKRALGKIGYDLHIDYISKLYRDVLVERTTRYNKHTKAIAIAKYEDFVQDLNNTLYNIKEDKDSSNKDKIFAIRTLVENQKSIINMLMDMGILERDLGRIRADIIDVASLAKLAREARNDPRFNIESTE